MKKKTPNILIFSPESRESCGTSAHLMALSHPITCDSWPMRMRHNRNHHDPLRGRQFIIDFPTKYVQINTINIEILTRITQNARYQRTSDGLVASGYMRMAHVHAP